MNKRESYGPLAQNSWRGIPKAVSSSHARDHCGTRHRDIYSKHVAAKMQYCICPSQTASCCSRGCRAASEGNPDAKSALRIVYAWQSGGRQEKLGGQLRLAPASFNNSQCLLPWTRLHASTFSRILVHKQARSARGQLISYEVMHGVLGQA